MIISVITNNVTDNDNIRSIITKSGYNNKFIVLSAATMFGEKYKGILIDKLIELGEDKLKSAEVCALRNKDFKDKNVIILIDAVTINPSKAEEYFDEVKELTDNIKTSGKVIAICVCDDFYQEGKLKAESTVMQYSDIIIKDTVKLY